MKKLTLCWLVLAVTLLTGCFGNNVPGTASPATDETAAVLSDGAYFAVSEEYSNGWKDFIAFTVTDGRIVSATWDGLPQNGSELKSTVAAAGGYSMKSAGAQYEWDEQARNFAQALIDAQGLPVTELDENGKTDAIAGVTIKVNEVSRLYEQALSQGPMPAGEYQDGLYYAQAPQYDNNGYAETVAMYISGGRIVWVNWDGVREDSEETKKSIGDGYGLKSKSSIGAEWYEQAQAFEAYVIENQGIANLTLGEDGKTDAISGCTITISGACTLAEQILAEAKVAG